MEYIPIIRGILVAIFIAVVMPNANVTNYKWWIAMLSLNVALVI